MLHRRRWQNKSYPFENVRKMHHSSKIHKKNVLNRSSKNKFQSLRSIQIVRGIESENCHRNMQSTNRKTNLLSLAEQSILDEGMETLEAYRSHRQHRSTNRKPQML